MAGRIWPTVNLNALASRILGDYYKTYQNLAATVEVCRTGAKGLHSPNHKEIRPYSRISILLNNTRKPCDFFVVKVFFLDKHNLDKYNNVEQN